MCIRDRASPVEGVWWRNFHDSTLNQYVDQALRLPGLLVRRPRLSVYPRQSKAVPAFSCLLYTSVSPFDFPCVEVNDGVNHPKDGGGGVVGYLRYEKK